MTRKISLHDGFNHPITVSLDATSSSVRINQLDGSIVLPRDQAAELFNAIRYVTGKKTK